MSKIDPNKLLISSDFYSVQGEGISSGVPSYFVRLGICNLTCGMSRKFANALAKEQKLEDGEIFVGDLHAEGKATWTCDSTSQWLWRGVDQDFQYLIDRWKEQGIYDDILNGVIHIIWTGGEPTIKGHQEAITNFFKYWSIKEDFDVDYNVYNEIETNGTVVIEEDLFNIINQINCSPKLANSGMTAKQRIVPDAIKRIMQHGNYQFKFVISTEEDVQELFRDFVVPFSIPLKNVVCMPGLDDQDDFHERTNFVLELAKKYRFRGLTRLHISAWNRVINV
jgi:7-carboxy-7-deazaguanine synthase